MLVCAREDGVTGLLVAGWLDEVAEKKNNEDGLGMTKHTGQSTKTVLSIFLLSYEEMILFFCEIFLDGSLRKK